LSWNQNGRRKSERLKQRDYIKKEKVMKLLRLISVVMVFGMCALASSAAGATDIKDTARAKAVQTQKAVVTIRLVAKLKGGPPQDEEVKMEAIGTVIDPDGLTVTDLSALDPAAMLRSIMGAMGRGDLKVSTEIKETTILLEDGTEIAADVVLKDSDLGLAFVRPREASRKFDAVNLKQRSQQPQLLDSIFTVGRLGKYSNRALTLTLDSIRAISKGPRSFYVGEKESQALMGCIAYSSDGEPMGMYVVKQKQGGSDEGDSFVSLGSATEALLPVIRPINDIIEIAQQAKKAKAPEKQGNAQPK
jgi:hypothetical protein